MWEAGVMVELISSLGTFGFVLWLVHRTTTHTIPRLAAQNADRQETQRADFIAALGVTRNDFKESLAEQRNAFQREMEREREVHGNHIDRLVDAIREAAK